MTDTDIATLTLLRDRIRAFNAVCEANDDTDTGDAWALFEDIESDLADIVKRHAIERVTNAARECAACAADMGSPADGRGLDDTEDAGRGDYEYLNEQLGRDATREEMRLFRSEYSAALDGGLARRGWGASWRGPFGVTLLPATRIATNRSVTPAREDQPMTEHEAVAILRDTYAIDATDATLDRLVDIGRVVGCNLPRDGAAFTRGDALDATITLLRADGARRVRS